jgi:hypothetical protein
VMFSQEGNELNNVKDYKDPEQFTKFRKRRLVIVSWQINQLKKGALVVRLKTNKKLIEALKKQGKQELAIQKEAEQLAITKNTILAYTSKLTFCKVYFIYSDFADSLLHGARKGIFLDSSLTINPSIEMSEQFYLIAERDYAYNSSIGFVKQDSAKYVFEAGNPVKEMAVVVKNKYGHQLKGPFPYYVKDKTYAGVNASVNQYVVLNGKTHLVTIGKQFSKEKLFLYMGVLDDNLRQFYQSTSTPEIEKINPEILPFLY